MSDIQIKSKAYKRCRIIKKWVSKAMCAYSFRLWLEDFEGNFNLMCANQRALRLLSYLKARPPRKGK